MPGPSSTADGIQSHGNSNSIKVTWLPSVDLRKILVDYGANFLSLILVVVTILQLALLKQTFRADRPFLLVEAATLRGFDDIKGGPTEVSFTFKNFGKRPAIIDEIRLHLNHVSKGEWPTKRNLAQAREVASGVYAVGVGEILATQTEAGLDGWESPLDKEDVRQAKRVVICYGRVVYSDPISEAKYETGFLWYYLPHPPDYLKLAEAMGRPRKYKGRFLPARKFYYHT